MYNKAICQKSTGQIKYIIVATAPGFLEKGLPGPAEFEVFLNDSDYHMAVREPEKYMVSIPKEPLETVVVTDKGSKTIKNPKIQIPHPEKYKMTMIAKPVKKEKEIEAPPIKSPVKDKTVKDKKK